MSTPGTGTALERGDAVQAKVAVQVCQSCSVAVCQHHVCYALPCQDAAEEACAAAQLEAAFACKA
jgi:ribosomal protein L32